MQPDDPCRCLLVKEMAKKLSVSDQHIINAIEQGELGAIDVSGSAARTAWRVPPEWWEDYVREHVYAG